MVISSTSKLLTLPSSIHGAAWIPRVKRSIQPVTNARNLLYQPRQFSSSNGFKSARDEAQSSVNHAEVSHFTALASTWWDPQGSSRLLHLMNPLRHDFIRRCINTEPPPSDKKLAYLDVGCGGGIFAESAARLHDTQRVVAIDPTPDVIRIAKQHQRQDPLLLEQSRLQYVNTAIENLSIDHVGDTTFDVLTVFEVLEHVEQPAPFLNNCLRHLKPGGWLIGSTIARSNTSWFTTKLVAEDILRIVPRGTHEWSQYIQPNELRSWAQSNVDLQAEGINWQVQGVMYVPGLSWKEVQGSETWGNYFFGVRKHSTM